jgi:hypothetical protein
VTAELLPVLTEGAGRAPSFDGLDETAEAAAWPRVEIGAMTLEGEGAWREAIGRAALPHRRQLREALGAPWATAPLVATAAARGRLRDWYNAGRPVPTAHDLVSRLRYLGDARIRDVALRALQRVPPPAVSFLLDNVMFCGVGWSAGGWTIQTTMAAGGPCVVVLLSGAGRDEAALSNLILHELSHAWLIPSPASPLRPDEMFNANAASLMAAARSPEQMATWLRIEDVAERQADALAATWGAGVQHSAAHARKHTLAEAEHLTRTYGGAR